MLGGLGEEGILLLPDSLFSPTNAWSCPLKYLKTTWWGMLEQGPWEQGVDSSSCLCSIKQRTGFRGGKGYPWLLAWMAMLHLVVGGSKPLWIQDSNQSTGLNMD